MTIEDERMPEEIVWGRIVAYPINTEARRVKHEDGTLGPITFTLWINGEKTSELTHNVAKLFAGFINDILSREPTPTETSDGN